MLELLGRREEAIAAYRWFDEQLVGRAELQRNAEWITEIALGFLRYSVLTRNKELPRRARHVLNEMLQVAYERVDRTYWPARIAAADLLRERYNNDEEDGSISDYKAALRINENLPQAYVGMGEVALQRWDFEEVERLARRALNVNPNDAPALHLLAGKLVLERRYGQAIEVCERALAINPNDLSALSISAAASACQYDDGELRRTSSRVAAINPRCALLHRTLGDALSGIRQYAASEAEYKKAIEIDPTDANAHTELGMMYMQWGAEKKARAVLDRAWALDPFNERTKFTLELLEKLEKFDRVETEHFIVKYDAAREPGIGDFVAEYLEGVYESVTGDYETPLSGKTIIELFPTHRAFGVRITGKPWIHTVGACTGRVIALASPRDVTGLGSYNLARVLKHEFTHTVTLEATHNRIPHWFTEGLAVYQEDAPRAFAWCEMLADALRRDRLFTLESIDWGFIRPRRPGDRQLAYAQSEWMCEYIVERFGYDAINAMIRRFRQGQRQNQVFMEELGIGTEEFNGDFREWARQQAVRWGFDLAPPENADELRRLAETTRDDASLFARLACAELDGGEFEGAFTAAKRALELDENQRIALDVLAKILTAYAEREERESARRALDDKALPVLERLLAVDPDGWTAPKYLADIALRRGEYDRAVGLLKRLQRLCPIDPTSWRGLAGVYLERGLEELALPQLLELARIEGNDSQVPAGIAAIYKHRGRWREARFWYQSALYSDPFSVELHEALGDTNMQVGDTRAALREYRTLAKLEPDNPTHFENAAFAAHKIGDKDLAESLAREALKLDPASGARSLVP
jgi:tetratricopeptide (TPR) repeat protein